ncbi:uncharacterized protein LOC101046212 isoform X1 [Saimiri boliviensis]|uniref:uncharacterized protein LOC101046212 isoform X1 n=1 Tax=Saimiri boliviensis TaxID=27679 RepID=UPI000533C77C|nr:uncharacterized protein LOC101046212 isoform X2 [Saimiri boliviensis boliviensis]
MDRAGSLSPELGVGFSGPRRWLFQIPLRWGSAWGLLGSLRACRDPQAPRAGPTHPTQWRLSGLEAATLVPPHSGQPAHGPSGPNGEQVSPWSQKEARWQPTFPKD